MTSAAAQRNTIVLEFVVKTVTWPDCCCRQVNDKNLGIFAYAKNNRKGLI